MERQLIYEIERNRYLKEDIKSMNLEEVKMLLSFIDNEKDLLKIANLHSEECVSYVNELLRTLPK